jgi:hypothetical protein
MARTAARCSGTAANCPANGFLPSSTMCRAANATNPCDVAEFCNHSCCFDIFGDISHVFRLVESHHQALVHHDRVPPMVVRKSGTATTTKRRSSCARLGCVFNHFRACVESKTLQHCMRR